MAYLDLQRSDGIATVWIDQPGETHNTLSPEALRAFEDVLDAVQADDGVRAVVFISRKPDSFIVGADVRVLTELDGRDQAERLSRDAHRLVDRVRELGKPSVAAIHGPALGGGLETALTCSYRIATEHPSTRLGLPEVRLGLLPGGGGTQLLPRLVGVQQALTLLLTGKNVYPAPARRMGLVDALVHPAGLLEAAREAARRLADGRLTPRREAPRSLTERALESNTLTRRALYRAAEARARKETGGHYPAPDRIVACVRTGMERGLEAGLEAEARHFADLVFSPEARELIFLFFAQRELKKNPWKASARPVDTLAVLGAGLMGSGIAQVSADAGYDVLVKDQTLALAAKARRQVWTEASARVRKRALTSFQRDVVVERVTPTDRYEPFRAAALVVEAAPEDLALKRRLLVHVEAETDEHCVFASNTSSIPIAQIAQASKRPETVLGMHYFSPVPKMPLLELIRTEQTAEWALGTAYDVGLRQDKTIIVVRDGPGFYTTRILAQYMNQALDLLDEGARIDEVDAALRGFGFPMGPYELFDLVGLDVSSKIADVLADFFEGRGGTPNRTAARMTEAGLKGRKTGSGFYEYSDGKEPQKRDVNEAAYGYFAAAARRSYEHAHLQDRLALAMVNEAARCLEEGIVEAPRDGDVGAVFGLGFPPFRGGPFRYVDAQTAPAVVARLARLAIDHGPAYEPAEILRRHAQDETRFYPAP